MLRNIIGEVLPINFLNMRKISLLNIIFIVQVVLFGAIITGILPREVALYLAGGLAVYVLIASLEDTTVLFVRSIPLFLALPITTGFDNFNTWRILAGLIFLKWFFRKKISERISQIIKWLKSYNYKKPSVVAVVLLLLSVISFIFADDKVTAIKRIIYFVNLSLIGIVIYDLAKNTEFKKRLIKNIAIPTIIVVVVGFIQVISTYFMDIYQFMALWGEGIQCRQFGNQWCYIAVHIGNTWLAYYGPQLSLRVFSLFPDSHSFPQFILLGLSSIFAMSLYKISEISENFKKMIHTRAKMFVLWIPVIFLIAILTGTRGIWAASAGVLLIMFGVIFWMKRTSVDVRHKNIFKYASSYIIIFFMLFAVAYPIFVSPQFLLSKGDWGLLGNRIKSIVDFGETSNAQRILIWKKSLVSIAHHPILGVGIGNYPVVLSQDIQLSKAGSSAHNLYLHIAAEMGIPALIVAVWFLWLLFKKSYDNFVLEKDSFIATYFAGTLIFVPWVLIYCLTDVALFDERAFLLFVTTIALILSNKNPDKVGD